MKKALLLLLGVVATFTVSCVKEDTSSNLNAVSEVNVSFDWSNVTQTPEVMKVIYFPIDGGEPFSDIIYSEGGISLVPEGDYSVLCYNFDIERIRLRGVDSYSSFEAYTSQSTRTTIIESSVSEPDNFYAASNERITVSGSTMSLILAPLEYVHQLTFAVKDFSGVENILDARGALSGMPGSVFIGKTDAQQELTTVLFDNGYEIRDGQVWGGLKVFNNYTSGVANILTIEILSGKGIYQKTFDVTDQLRAGRHIEVSLGGLVIEKGADQTGSGFESDVSTWKETEYPIDIH